MRLTCPSCQTNYSVDDQRIPAGGAKLKCAKCQAMFAVHPQASAPALVAVPLPDAAAAVAQAMRTSIPLPGAARAPIGYVPSNGTTATALPGRNSGRVANFERNLESAVPLPGERGAGTESKPAIPLPGATWDDGKSREFSQPLLTPAAKPGPIQLPGFGPVASDLDVGFADAELIEPPPETTAPLSSTVPLPGAGLPAAPSAIPDRLEPLPSSAAAGIAPEVTSQDSGELNFDFGDSAEPVGREPAHPRAADVPQPVAVPRGAEASVVVELESDGAGPSEEVEFDISEDSLAQSTPEQLEELSFVDSSAAQPASKSPDTRYYVRRKTGKVFGPFDEAVIVKWLQAGQMSGTEEISTDKETWSPLASVPRFQEAIEKLLEAPPEPPARASPIAPQWPEAADATDRLKRLYEGRMAAVSVVRRRSLFDGLGKKVPMLIGAGGLLLLVAAGFALGFTQYGVFGVRKLLPARIADGSPQFSMLQDARKALLADTFKSYQDANQLAATVLRVREYPEARAVWCQSVFYLQRRYGAAKPADVARANSALEEIKALGQRNIEVVKAAAGAALAASRPRDVLGLLQEAASRSENDGDLEVSFLLAEAYSFQGQPKLATETLTKVLSVKRASAKALHALGNLYQGSNEAEKAAQAYSQALRADPKHAASAVELAAVELLLRKNVQTASDALRRALEPTAQALLGPAELARARALRGAMLALQFKPKEAILELEESVKLDPKSNFAKEHLATLLLSQREHAKAIPLYKEILLNQPQDLEATDGYLSALIGAGKMEDALASVSQANVRFPGNARIAYLYGRINDALDKPGEAEKHYKRAISANPKLLEPTLYLARLYIRFRRIAEAKAQLEAAATQAPDDPRVHVGLGELALGEHDLARSKSEFDRAKTLDPKVAEAHLGLSRVSFEQGSLQAAKESVERALQLDPNVSGGRLQHGLVLWKTGKAKEAISELKLAKAQEPRSTIVATTVGAVMLDQGDLAGAEANLLSALAIDPASPEAHFHLAKLKSRRGEYNQAIDTMKTALERAPNLASFHYELGLIYRDARKLPEAIPEWKRAVELDPSHADSLEALGQAYLDGGEFESAVASFEASLRADSTRTRVLGLIGDSYFLAAKWDQAIAKYLTALKADESLTNVYFRLGRAHTEKGQHRQAITWYRKATEADAKNPMPYYYLGYAYKEKHRKKDAIEAFQSYLALKQNAEDRKEIEDEIYDLEHE